MKVDTPPFGYYDKNGTLTGFDIDLAKLITKKTLGDENKAIFVPVNTSNRIMKLASQEVDMIIATMSVTPQREMILDFSIPYHTAGQAILVRNSSNITTLSELNNKKIALVFGSTVEKNLRTIIPNAIILGYKTYTEAFNALKEGKAEYWKNFTSCALYYLSLSSTKPITIFRKFVEQDLIDLFDLINYLVSSS